ncbi:hypothetical protein VA603_01825, partial [Stenotrophomonas sp. MH1]|nr:hypothetical protein [Stenotrophomonas sp. MH1]
MPDFTATFPWETQLQRLQHHDPALASLALFDADGLTEVGRALEQVLQAGQALARCGVDVGLVADELRRYQKFAPPG